MMFRSVIVAAVLAAASAQCPDVPASGCNICPEGTCVQAPDAIFVFPGQPTVPCGMLQLAGLEGQIPLEQCPFLPGLVGDCACGVPSVDTQTDAPVPAPTDAPMPAPTDAPMPAPTDAPGTDAPEPPAAGSCPDVPDGGCNVCAPGTCVQAPDEIFEFVGQPPVPCGLLESSGLGGLIPQPECGFLPAIINTICDCGVPAVMVPPTAPPVDPTMAPVPDPPMTDAPVPEPPATDAPVPEPPATDAPVPEPPATDAPMPTGGGGEPTPASPTPEVPDGSCPSIPPTGCSICGDGTCVQNPDAVFMFPGQPTVPCGVLQQAGLDGMIPLESCPFLPEVTGVCECGAPGAAPTPPGPTPVPMVPTPGPPTPSGVCPDVPPTGCSICGDGLCVQNADAIFMFPGQPTVPCGMLEGAGLDGTIPLQSCPFLPEVTGVCECGVPGSAPAPTPTVFTPMPVDGVPTGGAPTGGGSSSSSKSGSKKGGAGGSAKSGKMGMGEMMMKKDKTDDSQMPMSMKSSGSRRRVRTAGRIRGE